MRILKQAEGQYPRDDSKVVYTPEQEGLIAELAERLRQRAERGEIGPLDAASPQSMTDALQEYILHRKEREYFDDEDYDYDKALNDQEAGLPG